MSHYTLRKQNNCLNCGTFIHGRFCHNCGQENIEPKETFWHLVTHFVYDVTHFDGKFFSTLKYLLFKPGFLSKEYIRGRRMSYLNPIRMYVFVSAFFFLFFFSLVKPDFKSNSREEKKTATQLKTEIKEEIAALNIEESKPKVSAKQHRINQTYLQDYNDDLNTLSRDSNSTNNLKRAGRANIQAFDESYVSLHEYDSIQQSLAPNTKDNWLKKQFFRKLLHLSEEYKEDETALWQKIVERFIHSFPQIFFVSLPLIALLLKLLYIRRRKTFYYVDHVIYLIHVYCAMFILMFLLLGFSKTEYLKHLSWTKYLMLPLSIYLVWYIYKSMRNFYRQGRGKTILKFLLLLSLSFFLITFLLMASFIFSLFAV